MVAHPAAVEVNGEDAARRDGELGVFNLLSELERSAKADRALGRRVLAGPVGEDEGPERAG
jgi:hypothetical protein